MRAYRREHDHTQIWKYDWPAGAECVGGRTGRRRHDKSVGAIRAERRAVGDNIEVEHPAERALDDHDVVERAEMLAACAGGALALDDRRERDAPRDAQQGSVAAEYDEQVGPPN